MRKVLSLLIVFFCVLLTAYSQPENASVETINGKKYYVHFVEQGNTLYGIKQLYGVSIESILEANEGLSNNLVLGQKIYIPIAVSNEKFYGEHTVVRGETLYGISKKYKCSIEDIKGLNDNLSEGLSLGQIIVVPLSENNGGQSEVFQSDPVRVDYPVQNQYNVSLTDSIVMHTVLAHETMYSIAKRYMVSQDTIMAVNNLRNSKLKKGDILKIPIKNVNYKVIDKDLTNLLPQDSTLAVDDSTRYKESYNIALLLPLMLDRNDQVMGGPLKVGQLREMYGTTKISFDFYQGFIMAADSLTNAGLNVNIYIYDTKKDTTTIGKYFMQPEFQDMDLVVGPLYGTTIEYTAKLCADKHIRIVLPFNSKSEVLYNNPYVYKGVASNMTLMGGAVDYIIENHKHHNIIIVKPTSAEDIALYEYVKVRFNEKIKEAEEAYNISIIETSAGSSSGKGLNAVTKSDTTNIFIIPSTSLTFVSGVMSSLNKVLNMNPYAKNLNIISFGIEDWNRYEDLDLKYRNRTTQHYASYRFLDYDSPKGITFIREYRKKYGTDPNVYSSQGFDFGMYFLSALYLYGTNFDLAIAQHHLDLIQNDFQFRTVENGSGKENQRVCIVKYDNYTLVQMK